jgi:cyclin-dependent kinase regulatory subunit CKS1
MAKNLPKGRVMTEMEWRGIGVQQSRGWEHYAYHRPEPHILLFRRPLGTVSCFFTTLYMKMLTLYQ